MFIVIGAASAAVAIAAGAFGAHGLEDRLSPEMLDVFEVGARYHMYHSLGLIAIGLLQRTAGARGRGLRAAGRAMIVGVVLFSGSLYTLALTGVAWLGAITPIGGLAFLLGWTLLARAAWASRETTT